MFNKTGILLMSLLLGLTSATARDVTSLNDDWRFARFGPMPDGSELAEPEGLESPELDDADWRVLNVPHDWGIEGPFRAELPNNTGKLPWAGIGWYRKTIPSPESDKGKRVFVEFDGAMSGNTVFLNGTQVGEWPYGYSSFRVELTDHLNVGGENILDIDNAISYLFHKTNNMCRD